MGKTGNDLAKFRQITVSDYTRSKCETHPPRTWRATQGWVTPVTFRGDHGHADRSHTQENPHKQFAGPDRSYPIEDRAHAANAKARAKQQSMPADSARANTERSQPKLTAGSAAQAVGNAGRE